MLAIVVLLMGTSRDIGRRLLDGVDPVLVRGPSRPVASLPGIVMVDDLRMRWIGPPAQVDATVAATPPCPSGSFHALEHEADRPAPRPAAPHRHGPAHPVRAQRAPDRPPAARLIWPRK